MIKLDLGCLLCHSSILSGRGNVAEKRKNKTLFEKLKVIQDANSLHLKVIKSSPRFVQNILPP